MFPGQFYEKWMSVRERNIKLLLENSHLDNYNRDSDVHNAL